MNCIVSIAIRQVLTTILNILSSSALSRRWLLALQEFLDNLHILIRLFMRG
jgi:hypothetical protein